MAKKKTTVHSHTFADGTRSIEQLLAPHGVSMDTEYELKIDDYYVRTSAICGYPSTVTTGWMNLLYAYDGNIDIVTKIQPCDERTAIDELTSKITQYEAQLMSEMDKGSIRNVTSLQAKIQTLYEQRKMLEQNHENMFYVSSFFGLYDKNKDNLDKESQKLSARLAGRKIMTDSLPLRQDKGYMEISPFLISPIGDFGRNMNTGAVSTMFPFGNPESADIHGTFIGRNPNSGNPVFVDFFNRAKYSNANIFISGIPGSGKSYFVSLLVLRSTLEGIRHVLIDPEGEYKRVTEILQGSIVKLAPNSQYILNPMDIDMELELDDDGEPTGRTWVDIKGKVSELLNLFGVMFPTLIQNEGLKAILSKELLSLYSDFGFTEDVSSLYEQSSVLDPATGVYRHDKILKKMPRFTDFRNKLIQANDKKYSKLLEDFIDAFSLYTEGGIYDMFDRESTVNLDDNTIPVITFDLSGVEDEMLRPIALNVTTNWAWNKFMKKELKNKKRIVCDEAWMFVKKSIAGSRYSAHFLENCSRRCRKYNGSLCIASQNFREFTLSEEGQNVLSYSAVKFFMKQDVQDIGAVSDRFILTDGEKQFLLRANRGSTLLKIGSSTSMLCDVVAFPFEDEMISRKFLNNSETSK